MSKFYHVIRDCYGKWIKSPNNGGECCTTQEDTVEALNQLIQERDALQARVKRLEDVILAADKFLDAVQDDEEIDYHDWVCKVADARTAYNFAKQTAKETKP